MGSLVILGNSLSQEPPAPRRLSNTGRISVSACASLCVCVCVCGGGGGVWGEIVVSKSPRR